MRIERSKLRMEVRCCCDAGKLLGTVPVSREYKPGDHVNFLYQVTPQPLMLTLPVGQCFVQESPNVSRQKAAIKSMDTPIETLRKIPGFEEAA